MDPFWQFARRMLRYRGLLVLALTMAVVSATSLGVGLSGTMPILRQVLSKPDGKAVDPELEKFEKGLPRMVADWNRRHPGLGVSEDVIRRLPEGQFTAIVCIVGALAALTVFGGLANFLHAFLSLTLVNRTIAGIRRQAFHAVMRMPLRDLVVSGPTDAVNRIVGDSAALSTGFTALVSKAVAESTKGAAALVVALVTNVKLTAVAIVVGLIVGVLLRKIGTKIRRASKAAMASQSGLYTSALEALQGLRVVKVHTTERYEAGRFHRINKENMRELNRVRTARAMASPLIEVIAIFVLGGFVLAATKVILDKQLEPEEFLLTLGSLGLAAATLRPLAGLLNDIQASSASAERLRELLATRPEPGHDHRLAKLARHSGSIEFRGVTFTYPRQKEPALRGVSLTVRHGETVAVVGSNGSGKTTLLALVPRLFEPDAGGGSVLVDGRDIREVSVKSLRRQIGVVTQETVLFRGTIAANIAYGAEGVTQAKVVDAAKRARADEFIGAQPKGYDTPVAEQGLSLSGGQRQRIAIARAILRDPAILILDEATSMIDADSEAKIAAALAEFCKGRTCLIVAHRLSTVLNADRIVVMDQGRIVDQGTHGELLSRCEPYKRIAQHQLLGGDGPSN